MSYRPRALRLPLPLPCRALAARLAVVEAAVTPNHGSSLRDAVDRVESTVNRIGVTTEADHPSCEGDREVYRQNAREFLDDLAALSAGEVEYEYAVSFGDEVRPRPQQPQTADSLSTYGPRWKKWRRQVGPWEEAE